VCVGVGVGGCGCGCGFVYVVGAFLMVRDKLTETLCVCVPGVRESE
jgi:hypothetical protein